MELQTINQIPEANVGPAEKKNTQFIEANTKNVSLSHLKQDCTIPVFAKDNEITISHSQFIESVLECTNRVFKGQKVINPAIRVSHIIKGRTPNAINKAANELLPEEKTIYYERCAFIIEVPTVKSIVDNNTLSLTVGGVRAYNQENLYSRKSLEKFKVFIGFKNWVCTNMCISTDGLLSEIKASNLDELKRQVFQLFANYKMEDHLQGLRNLAGHSLTENQFAQFLGKARLYNHLPKEKKKSLPELLFNDGQLNAIAKDYYLDDSFCKNEDGSISLWKVYNLFTGANKTSYIDSFLERNVNAHTFTNSIAEALSGNSDYHWFLS